VLAENAALWSTSRSNDGRRDRIGDFTRILAGRDAEDACGSPTKRRRSFFRRTSSSTYSCSDDLNGQNSREISQTGVSQNGFSNWSTHDNTLYRGNVTGGRQNGAQDRPRKAEECMQCTTPYDSKGQLH
jgi:hypothetical protein